MLIFLLIFYLIHNVSPICENITSKESCLQQEPLTSSPLSDSNKYVCCYSYKIYKENSNNDNWVNEVQCIKQKKNIKLIKEEISYITNIIENKGGEVKKYEIDCNSEYNKLQNYIHILILFILL